MYLPGAVFFNACCPPWLTRILRGPGDAHHADDGPARPSCIGYLGRATFSRTLGSLSVLARRATPMVHLNLRGNSSQRLKRKRVILNAKIKFYFTAVARITFPSAS